MRMGKAAKAAAAREAEAMTEQARKNKERLAAHEKIFGKDSNVPLRHDDEYP